MKLMTYRLGKITRVGVLSENEEGLFDISRFGLPYTTMPGVIYNMTKQERAGIDRYLHSGENGGMIPLQEAELLAPVPVPEQDVICLGVNYADHAAESSDITGITMGNAQTPAIYFSKRVNEAVAPYGEIDGHTDIVKDLDYEVELAVIVGKDALNVRVEEAEEYIFGYTIVNDVSARTLQSQHRQWYRGKSLDTFTPMGPWIVTADAFAFPPALAMECRVNGELRQEGNTGRMIHGIAEIIADLSAGMTLKAGTIIATGTPSGVAMGMKNPAYLKPGDTVECRIEGIGTIRNKIR